MQFMQLSTAASVYHTQSTIEPDLLEVSYSLGVKLTMTVSPSVYYMVLSTWVQSVSLTL